MFVKTSVIGISITQLDPCFRSSWSIKAVLSLFFSFELTHPARSGIGYDIYHSVPFDGTEELDLSRFDNVKAWPNMLHLVYAENFNEPKPHFVTSKTITELLSKPFMMDDEGSQFVYQLAALFFVPSDGHLIHFELEKDGSNAVLINKSCTEPYKNWSFLDFQNARLKPKGHAFLHAYYVKQKYLNLFLDLEPFGAGEEVFKVERKVYNDDQTTDQITDQTTDQSNVDASKDNSPKDSNNELHSPVKSNNGSNGLFPSLFFPLFIVFASLLTGENE